MRKIVFLDIDGVINSDNFFYKTRVVEKVDKGYFDPEAISLLNQLEDCEVVISSSWGEDADEHLVENGLKLPIIGHTEHFHNDWILRGNEILKWLKENAKYGDDFQYVIFDDDDDMLLWQKNNFVLVNRKYGLRQKDIDKAKKIFSK